MTTSDRTFITKGVRRPNWVEYGLDLAEVVRSRCQDPYVQVGAVVMRADHSIAGVGYNGPPSGVELDWSDRDLRRDFVIHAEVNAFRDINRRDVAGGMVCVTGIPCVACLAVIRSMDIRHVFYREELENYPAEKAMAVARQLGVFLYHEVGL
jgi:dCMP deaminase